MKIQEIKMMAIFSVIFLMLLVSLPFESKTQTTPEKIQFVRQGVKRIIFDKSQRIPLSSFKPAKIVGLEVMHPKMGEQRGDVLASLEKGVLILSADKDATQRRWISGFNAFATYDLVINKFSGSVENGIIFSSTASDNSIDVHITSSEGRYKYVSCIITKEGQIMEQLSFDTPEHITSNQPLTLRVQMLAVGANIFVEQLEQTTLVGRFDFVNYFDLRKKDLMRRFEVSMKTKLASRSSTEIQEASAYISPGMGQADLRIVTYEDGSTYFYEDKLWILITVRGRGLPHPMQGVYSLNPSVFDIQFEGIILYDRGDGRFRNELASNIFYDRKSKEWRGFTTGFSSYGDPFQKEKKEILAVSSFKMPLKGISVMKAKSIGLIANYEDPQCIYDKDADKWRMLLCESHDGYKAVIRESDTWDGEYKVIAGPIDVNSTGTQLQKIGGKFYAFFGSSQRKIFIYSYPSLKPYGELNIQRPPWDDKINTRVWPNIVALPEGYPSPYIALMMDRNNFPGMEGANWTYGAMYLYHGYE